MKILGPDYLTGDFTKCLKNTGKKKKIENTSELIVWGQDNPYTKPTQN